MIRKLHESETKRSELEAFKIESEGIIIDKQRIIDESDLKLNQSIQLHKQWKTKAGEFLRNHILYEAWMSKKKSETNRNGYDKAMNELSNRIKGGETITIQEYINTIH